MTTNERYENLLMELSELLKSKNDTIKYQGYLVEMLERKLEAAEKEIAELKGGAEDVDGEADCAS